MMETIINNFGTERLAGLATTLVVVIICMVILFQPENPNYPRIVVASLLFVSFLGLEILVTPDTPCSDGMYLFLNGLQVATLIAVFFTVPYNFMAILLCVWCGNLLNFMSLKRAIQISPIFLIVYASIYTWYWGFQHMFYSAPLYWTLCIFTMVMINSWVKENEAKEASQRLNRELLAAQSLLKEATKQSERVRIARDIHDLVGHHLTALTINLQVAMHQSEGEAKQQVEQSYAIAKLLLADVREAVTEIREKSNLQLRESLEALLDSVPRLKVQLHLQEDLSITNVELAETILKCVQESITNSLKHSNSSQFEISLVRDKDELVLSMQDDGGSKEIEKHGETLQSIVHGNGLTGMKERIAALKGQISFETNQHGFLTLIKIPEAI